MTMSGGGLFFFDAGDNVCAVFVFEHNQWILLKIPMTIRNVVVICFFAFDVLLTVRTAKAFVAVLIKVVAFVVVDGRDRHSAIVAFYFLPTGRRVFAGPIDFWDIYQSLSTGFYDAGGGGFCGRTGFSDNLFLSIGRNGSRNSFRGVNRS